MMKKHPLIRGRSFDVRYDSHSETLYTSSEADLKQVAEPTDKYKKTGPFLTSLTKQLTALGLPPHEYKNTEELSSNDDITYSSKSRLTHSKYTSFGSLSSLNNFGSGAKMSKTNSVKPSQHKMSRFSIKHKPLRPTRSYYTKNRKDIDIGGLKPSSANSHLRNSSSNLSLRDNADISPSSKPSFKKSLKSLMGVDSGILSPVHRCTDHVIQLGQDEPLDLQSYSISQVTRHLFIGSVDALYNDHLLCHFSIDYLIDVTNIAPDSVPQVRKSSQKCNCPAEIKHFRPKLNVEWSSTTALEFLEDMFDEVNRFIESARSRMRNVLIASFNGETRCGLLAMQYIIKYWHYQIQEAFNHLKNLRPIFSLTPDHRRALTLWEKKQRRIWVKSGSLPLNRELLEPETSA